MNHDLKDTLDRLGAAMLRSGGELDLYARVENGRFVVAMYTDAAGQVAIGVGDTLTEAVGAVRSSLGAAVREAVMTP